MDWNDKGNAVERTSIGLGLGWKGTGMVWEGLALNKAAFGWEQSFFLSLLFFFFFFGIARYRA